MVKELTQTLKTLIAFETVTGNQKECEKALHWYVEQVRHLHQNLYIETHTFDGYPALTITTQQTKNPKLWLAAHIDVVPGKKELFRPKEKSGRLTGRGAYDMKFAIACYLMVLKDIGKNIPHYNFGIMLTSDEEIGGWNGTKKLLEKGYLGEACFLPDGGENWVLEEEVKGGWHLIFTSVGVSAHASQPWEGANAIEELIAVITEFSKEFESVQNDSVHFHRTLTVSNISGGNGAINKVPDYATATCDIRFTSNEEQQWLEKRLLEIEKEHLGVTHETKILTESFSVNPEHAFIEDFRACIPKGEGEGTLGMLSHGSSDARFFAAQGVPTISTRPLGSGAHSNTEWIDVKDLERFYQAIRCYVRKVAKQ